MRFWKALLGAKKTLNLDSAQRQIHDAAKGGDLEKAKAMLKANPDSIFIKDDAGRTPLHAAAQYGHKDLVALLLTNKAYVDAKDNNGWHTPLHLAVGLGLGRKDVVELLLLNKANVNAKAKDGATPLHGAVTCGKEVVKLLLARKAKVNSKTHGGLTPMHLAAAFGKEDVAQLLLANKANVNAKAKNGRTPLHWAAEIGHRELAALLLANKAKVNAKTKHGATPLHLAAATSKTWLVELLLAHGATLNIHDAAACGDLEKVKTLLKAKPELVFSEDNFSSTPLHWAAKNGHKDVVALLLECKAEINAKDNYRRDLVVVGGLTPLHWAAGEGHKDVVQLLLTNNAEVNAKDNARRTPLRWALCNRCVDIAKLLREHGGNE